MTHSRHLPIPPLCFLACLFASWGADRLRPWHPGLPRVLRLAMALVIALPAGVIALWTLAGFVRARTTLDPKGQPSVLMVRGPFRISRNPLYLVLAASLAWIGLVRDSVWGLLTVPVLVVILDLIVIPGEEARLVARFGDSYRAYRHRVRRWL